MTSLIESENVRVPGWIVPDLRSDHAGEASAVAFCRGALATARTPAFRAVILHHLRTERRHLAILETILAVGDQSRVLPVWRAAGWLLGAAAAVFGTRAFYITIIAVESFLEHHYTVQIRRLGEAGRFPQLRRTLEALARDAVRHRREAAKTFENGGGVPGRIWRTIVSGGSAAAIAVARRV
jgi:ubiquinone biosynthesis monooxygenase Coq7